MDNVNHYPLHGGQLRQIAERFHIALPELLDFSANINPSGPPPSVLSALRDCLDDASVLREYPDLQETNLKLSLARAAGMSPEHLIVANGFVPLLEAVLRALKIRRCLLPLPSFGEYRGTLDRMGVDVVPHALTAESSFLYDAEQLLTGEHRAILLANPQNPSGVCHDLPLLRDLTARAAARKIYVLLDEAFIDYVPEQSLAPLIDQFSNLILFRSLTKFYSIAGLRVAYAIAAPAVASALCEQLPPWPVTTLAARAASAALEDEAYAARSIEENAVRRAALRGRLESLGLVTYPSAANFLLFRLPAAVDPDAFWEHMILHHHIVLRSCANYDSLPRGHLRVCVRTPEENETLGAAIESSLSALWRG